MTPKNIICLWYDKDAEEAENFYASVFPDSRVGAVHRAPADNPSSAAGAVLTVEFTVCGIPCIGLNGGPTFKHSEAFSFQIATEDQEETDRYWNAITGNDPAKAKRAFEAMMTMKKIDVAAIEAAVRG
jgi:predicted 3-demethylubiquinone-9 3-methyltransferase (glyoxalase superfamily)